MPEAAAPTLVNADQGTHWVTGPSGKGEVYMDKRGLGPEEATEECPNPKCRRKYLASARDQHLATYPTCRPADEWTAWREKGWDITPDPLNPLRMIVMHRPCGKNGNLLRKNLAFLNKHMAEMHPA